MGRTGRPRLTMHVVRRAAQLSIVVASLVTGYRFMAGLSLTSIERYCPMGGLATSYSLASEGQFSCATGEMNFAMLLALVLLAVVARKAFCSWLCPVGTVSEILGMAGAWLSGRSRSSRGGAGCLSCYEPPRKVDRWLRLARFVVLAVILGATFRTAELVFRPFCPYYVMFSFHGHDVQVWSYYLLGIFIVGVVAIPLIWCRYLCPLGGAMWPFSRFGLLRVRRSEALCTNCRQCDRVCGHSIEVSTAGDVRSGECTMCLECESACPASGALTLAVPRSRRALHWLVVPLVVLSAVAFGYAGGNLFALPSFARDYSPLSEATKPAEVRFVVRGVRCVDTAKLAASVFEGVPGVVSFVAYASRGEVVVTYDAGRTDIGRLVKRLQGPVYMEASGEFVFRVFHVLSVDGVEVAPSNKVSEQGNGGKQ